MDFPEKYRSIALERFGFVYDFVERYIGRLPSNWARDLDQVRQGHVGESSVR